MEKTQLQALIFDLDGTLADTLNAILEGINETMREYGYPTVTYEDACASIGNGARLLIARSMPPEAAADPEQVTRVLKSYDEAYAHTYMHTTDCYDGIPEAIRALHAMGYRIAVLSNKQDAYTKGLVRLWFPNGEIAWVYGQAADRPTKPDPTVPRLLAEQMGVAPTACAMIGDSDVDIKTAKNAGMISIGCAWGFRGRAVLEAAGADHVLDKPDELIPLLQR